MTSHIEQLAEQLAAANIRYAFGVTGSGSSLKLIEQLEKRGVAYYPVAHEAAAVMMAGACSRNGITQAVAIGIKGPGFVNFLPGIALNQYEGRPALTISEAYSTDTPLSRQHKRMPHAELASQLVKGYARTDGDGAAVAALLHYAQQEYPGPVHLDLTPEPDTSGLFILEQKKLQDSIHPDDILSRLKESSNPVVILGSWVTRGMRGFAWESLNVPVLTTAAAKGAINESSEYAGGIITGEIKPLSPENGVLAKADFVLGIGLRNSEVILAKGCHCPFFIADVIGGACHEGFEADGIYVSESLAKDIQEWFPYFMAWGDDTVRKHWEAVNEAIGQEDWLPPAVFRTIQRVVIDNPALVLDTGLFCTVGETVWKAATPSEFCGSSLARFMGVSIPTAIGLSVSNPGKPVVCVMGDGGIRPYIAEIRLAVDEKLPILFVLMSDGQYGTIGYKAGKGLASNRSFHIRQPSWIGVVEQMGCKAAKALDLNNLEDLLAGWKREEGPLFAELSFDAENYAAVADLLR